MFLSGQGLDWGLIGNILTATQLRICNQTLEKLGGTPVEVGDSNKGNIKFG